MSMVIEITDYASTIISAIPVFTITVRFKPGQQCAQHCAQENCSETAACQTLTLQFFIIMILRWIRWNCCISSPPPPLSTFNKNTACFNSMGRGGNTQCRQVRLQVTSLVYSWTNKNIIIMLLLFSSISGKWLL